MRRRHQTAAHHLAVALLDAGGAKLTILASAPGTGKTILDFALAAVVNAGERWPHSSECKGSCKVLILSGENIADDTLSPRLIASAAELARCDCIEFIAQDGKSIPLGSSQDIPVLRRAAVAIGGVSLMLIGPMVSAVDGDMHRANGVRRSRQAVMDFADVHVICLSWRPSRTALRRRMRCEPTPSRARHGTS